MICSTDALRTISSQQRLGSYALLEMSVSVGIIAIILTLSGGIWHVQTKWRERTDFAAEFIRAQDQLEYIRMGDEPPGDEAYVLREDNQLHGIRIISIVLSDGTELSSFAPVTEGETE